jgi:hypothetical protein
VNVLSDEEIRERKVALSAEIRRLLPDFVESCLKSEDMVIIHQDSFAADYQQDEYALLGKAIKFAGLHGKEIHIIGTNRENSRDHRNLKLYNDSLLMVREGSSVSKWV